jgi:hypothetical protein
MRCKREMFAMDKAIRARSLLAAANTPAYFTV